MTLLRLPSTLVQNAQGIFGDWGATHSSATAAAVILIIVIIIAASMAKKRRGK